jgi:hypothetical protein
MHLAAKQPAVAVQLERGRGRLGAWLPVQQFDDRLHRGGWNGC